jgi:hypothetical protein
MISTTAIATFPALVALSLRAQEEREEVRLRIAALSQKARKHRDPESELDLVQQGLRHFPASESHRLFIFHVIQATGAFQANAASTNLGLQV